MPLSPKQELLDRVGGLPQDWCSSHCMPKHNPSAGGHTTIRLAESAHACTQFATRPARPFTLLPHREETRPNATLTSHASHGTHLCERLYLQRISFSAMPSVTSWGANLRSVNAPHRLLRYCTNRVKTSFGYKLNGHHTSLPNQHHPFPPKRSLRSQYPQRSPCALPSQVCGAELLWLRFC